MTEAVTLGLMLEGVAAAGQASVGGKQQSGNAELRNAVRFPLEIPVKIVADGAQLEAMTENISATGILFRISSPLPLQMHVRFTMKMPAQAMGTAVDVVVHCTGRVVRCTASGECTRVAAVIDEYYFSQ